MYIHFRVSGTSWSRIILSLMLSPSIKDYKPDDLEDIVRIFNCARESASCYPEEQFDAEAMLALIEGEEVLVATLGKSAVGFASVWTSSSFLHHLYVSPDYQFQGVGSSLIEACKARFGLPLFLKCDQCNLKAQRYYRNRGWTRISEGAGDYGPWIELKLV